MTEDYRASFSSQTSPQQKHPKIHQTSPKIRQTKKTQRTEIRAQRAARPESERREYAEKLAEFVGEVAALCGGGPVASYMPLSGEPDPTVLTDVLTGQLGGDGELSGAGGLSGSGGRPVPGGLVFPRVVPGAVRALEWVSAEGGFKRRDRPPRVLEPVGPALASPNLAGPGVDSPNLAGPRVASPSVASPRGDGGLGRLVSAVLVPCLAVHSSGRRLGQGGGFYDTTLAQMPDGVPLIGVVFACEVRDDVAFEDHDAQLTHVICESGIVEFHPSNGG